MIKITGDMKNQEEGATDGAVFSIDLLSSFRAVGEDTGIVIESINEVEGNNHTTRPQNW